MPHGLCANALPIAPSIYPAVNNTLEKLWFVENSGDPVCDGNSGADLFYSFTTTELNTHVVNVNPFGGSDLVIQVMDGCGGTELACANVSGDGGQEAVLLENLDPG